MHTSNSVWQFKSDSCNAWKSSNYEMEITDRTMIKCRIESVQDEGTKMVGLCFLIKASVSWRRLKIHH